jgi:hypothetical protein
MWLCRVWPWLWIISEVWLIWVWKRKYLLLTLFLLRMTKITENRQHKTRHFRLLILNKKSDI